MTIQLAICVASLISIDMNLYSNFAKILLRPFCLFDWVEWLGAGLEEFQQYTLLKLVLNNIISDTKILSSI